MKKFLSILTCACITISSTGLSHYTLAANAKTDTSNHNIVLDTAKFVGSGVSSMFGSFFKGIALVAGYVVPVMGISFFNEMYNSYKAKSNCGTIETITDPVEVVKILDEYLQSVKGQDSAKEKIRKFVINLVDERNKRISGTSKKRGANLIYLVGPSGVGKSLTAEILTKVLTGKDSKPYIVEPSDIDKESKKASVVDQLFGMRTKKMNNSEYYEMSPLLTQLKSTPNMVVIINEYDKLHTKDLDEKLRTMLDQGYVKVNGEVIDCSRATFTITSNESLGSITKAEHNDDGSGSRTYVEHDKAFLNRINFIIFDNLNREEYKKIAQTPCDDLQKHYYQSYGFYVDFGNSVEKIAELTEKINQGARPIQSFIDSINKTILTDVVLKESGNRNYVGKVYRVSYDESKQDFVVNELVNSDNEETKSPDLNKPNQVSATNELEDSVNESVNEEVKTTDESKQDEETKLPDLNKPNQVSATNELANSASEEVKTTEVAAAA